VGRPVGLFRAARFSTRQFALGPGETLLFYTDGWTEATPGDGEEYGAARAAEAFARVADLPLGDLLAACRADLETYLGGAPRGDDLALMAVRRSGQEGLNRRALSS
jgi:sigma-B regulation protein RsbU (phosphoserine phosphatase)